MYQIDTDKLKKFFKNLSKEDKAKFAEALGFKDYQKEEGYIVPTADDFDDSFANQLDKDDKWALLAFLVFFDTCYQSYLSGLIVPGISDDYKFHRIYGTAVLLSQVFWAWTNGDSDTLDFNFKKLEEYITFDRFDKKYLEVYEIGLKDDSDNVLARFRVSRQLDKINQRIYKVKTWLLDGNEMMAFLDLSNPDTYFSKIAFNGDTEKFCRFLGLLKD
jgi:hypothetical protein